MRPLVAFASGPSRRDEHLLERPIVRNEQRRPLARPACAAAPVARSASSGVLMVRPMNAAMSAAIIAEDEPSATANAIRNRGCRERGLLHWLGDVHLPRIAAFTDRCEPRFNALPLHREFSRTQAFLNIALKRER